MDKGTRKIKGALKHLRILKKPEKKPLVVVLVGRMAFFFFVMSFLTIGLYIRGNFSDFTDGTQRLLLHIAGAEGVCLFFWGIVGVLLDIFMILRMKLTYVGAFVLYVIASGLGAGITLAALSIQTLISV
jgi:hypothetical protein